MNTPTGGFKSLIGIGFLSSISLIIMGYNYCKRKDDFSVTLFPILLVLFLILTGYIHIKALEKIQFLWRLSGVFFFPSCVIMVDFLRNNQKYLLLLCLINAILTTGSIIPNINKKEINAGYMNGYNDYIDLSAKNSFTQHYKDFNSKDIVVDSFYYKNGYPNYHITNTSEQELSVKSPVIYYRGINAYVNNITQNSHSEGRFVLNLKNGGNIIEYRLSPAYRLVFYFLYSIFFLYCIYQIILLRKKYNKKDIYSQPVITYPYKEIELDKSALINNHDRS